MKELDDSAQGTGFAFIVMADVFTKIPGAPFWSALFFLMLLSLGFGTQFSTTETVVTILTDQFPQLRCVTSCQHSTLGQNVTLLCRLQALSICHQSNIF